MIWCKHPAVFFSYCWVNLLINAYIDEMLRCLSVLLFYHQQTRVVTNYQLIQSVNPNSLPPLDNHIWVDCEYCADHTAAAAVAAAIYVSSQLPQTAMLSYAWRYRFVNLQRLRRHFVQTRRSSCIWSKKPSKIIAIVDLMSARSDDASPT